MTPISAFLILRYLGRMSVADSAGIAAHYGSTSAVTYAVADVFSNQQGAPPDTYLPTLVTILECPGIAIALAIGAIMSPKSEESEQDAFEPGAKKESRLW